MSVPSCSKCGNTTFLTWDYHVTDTAKVKLLYCSSCGAVVAGFDTERLERLEALIRDLARRLRP